jgi:hypothetical protein
MGVCLFVCGVWGFLILELIELLLFCCFSDWRTTYGNEKSNGVVQSKCEFGIVLSFVFFVFLAYYQCFHRFFCFKFLFHD